jgi:cytochrome c553
MNLKILFLIVLSMLSVVSQAETVDELQADMARIQADPVALKAAIQKGEERAILCFSCHGKDGNSKRDYIPNLASQNAAYLFNQFENFADGRRVDYVMSKLAKQLKDDERVAIALYFADRPVKRREEGIAVSAKGKQLYDSVCFACHGATAHGDHQYPRIAGQPYTYLESTLLKFLHKDPDRAKSPMVAVVQNMDEESLKAVATYLTNMP